MPSFQINILLLQLCSSSVFAIKQKLGMLIVLLNILVCIGYLNLIVAEKAIKCLVTRKISFYIHFMIATLYNFKEYTVVCLIYFVRLKTNYRKSGSNHYLN